MHEVFSLPKIVLAIALTAAALSLAGCPQKQSADVVATVNGHPIMRSEMEQAYRDKLGETPETEQPPQEQADSLRLGVLRQLIDEEIVQQRAAKMGLTATPEEVDSRFAEMKAPYPNDQQFNEQLAARHTSAEELKRSIRRSLTSTKLINKEINSKITVSDSDIATYYALHKSDFNNLHPKYHIARIVVTTSPTDHAGNLQGSKATSEADAKKKIQAIRNRIDSGEEFGALAMNFSEDPDTSASGGDMGVADEVDLEQKSPALFAAISKLKPGQVTDIIPFPAQNDPGKIGGYILFQLISHDPAGQQDISDPKVQQRIRQGLMQVRSQLLQGAYFEMLRDQAKVENFFAETIFKSDAK
jgi:peptidyl-prolyl cis-trans isomerase SurA